MRKNGPIGAIREAATASSIALIDRSPSSCMRQTSLIAALRMRLTTKPGSSPQVIGILRIVCANVVAACIVSGDVLSPSTTSTRRMNDAG